MNLVAVGNYSKNMLQDRDKVFFVELLSNFIAQLVTMNSHIAHFLQNLFRNVQAYIFRNPWLHKVTNQVRQLRAGNSGKPSRLLQECRPVVLQEGQEVPWKLLSKELRAVGRDWYGAPDMSEQYKFAK